MITMETPTLATELLYAVIHDDALRAERTLGLMTTSERHELDTALNRAAKLTNLYRQRYDK